jgi:hypothetical protein
MPTGTSPPIESKRSRPVSQHTALKFLMYVGVTGYQIVLPDCVASRAGVEPAAQGACVKRNHHFLSPSYACPEPVLVYHQLVFDFQIYKRLEKKQAGVFSPARFEHEERFFQCSGHLRHSQRSRCPCQTHGRMDPPASPCLTGTPEGGGSTNDSAGCAKKQYILCIR